MITFSLQRSISLAYAGLLLTTAVTSMARADDAEAVVRIQSSRSQVVTRGQSPQQMVRPVNNEVMGSNGCSVPSAPQTCCPTDTCCSTNECSSENCFVDCDPITGRRIGRRFNGRCGNGQCGNGQCGNGCRGGLCGGGRFGGGLCNGCRGGQCGSGCNGGGRLGSLVQQDLQKKCAWARLKFGYFIPTGNCGSGTPPFGHYSMVYPVNPQHFDARDGQVYAAQGYGGPVSVPLAPVVNHTYNYGWGIPSSRLTPVSHPVSPSQADAYRSGQYPGVPVQQ